MHLKQFLTGGDRNFGYLVADEVTREAVVIDPSYAPRRIYDYAKIEKFDIVYIFCTHAHSDHTNGNSEMEKLTKSKALLLGDADTLSGKTVRDGEMFQLGELEIEILHTPGHTEDSICLRIGDSVFTGDTLFVGKVGGTDFGAQARKEYDSLHEKLLTLPDTTRVFPGHNYGVAPESTIGRERESNPFLLQPDFESFVHLKKNWSAYKIEHGIS